MGAILGDSQLVRFHPSTILAAEQAGEFPAVRLWLILRWLDGPNQSGWLYLDDVLLALGNRRGRNYLYGKRRLKQVLQHGAGLYWELHKSGGRMAIRLIGQHRIMARFGVKLAGQEVTIPIDSLIQPDIEHGRERQAAALASVYESSHISRRDSNKPMTRRAVESMTGLSRYRQWRYERRREIVTRAAYDITASYTPHKMAWAIRRYGRGVYKHVDYLGLIGPANAKYIARRTGSRFDVSGNTEAASVEITRNRRRLNRKAARLCSYPDGGKSSLTRVYHDTEAQAVKIASREYGRADAQAAYIPEYESPRAAIYTDLSESVDSHYLGDMAAAMG